MSVGAANASAPRDALQIFPEAVASKPGAEQYLLSPGGGGDAFAFDAAARGLRASAATGVLGSALLYGRRFGDDTLPYDC